MSQLVTAYYSDAPAPSVTLRRVAFGTSGHRGSSLKRSFNENHILAITQPICLYRKGQGISGPLFLGSDTHALSIPACATALAVLATNGADVILAEVMGEIAKLLDSSITGVDMPAKPPPLIDLPKIDFEALRQRFKESKHKNTDLEVLKAAIRAQLEKLIRLNKTRMDFQGKFEELIESYNAGSRNIEDLFTELLVLSRALNTEQERHVRENLSEEELTVFDILTRPAPELSPAERAEIKKVARELLAKLRQLLVINWRQKSSARSQLKLTIEDVLEAGLPRAYSPELYRQKCSAVFEHIYESYEGEGASIFNTAA